jgi:transposase
MQIYESPEEGNHRYQRQLATALADGLGLDDGLKAAQSNGWEGVLDVLLGKRPVASRRHVVGPLIATALVASVPDPHVFKSGRDLAAWIGLAPRQNSTGGKERLGHISKAGNRYLRMLLVVGALSVIRRAKETGYTRRPWLAKLLERRSTKVAAIALANKNARTASAMMAQGTFYKEPAARAV